MTKLFTVQNKTAVQYAGLASLGSALIAAAISQLVTIKLNFWELLILLILGVGVFVYQDLRKKVN
jgi:hypothetical protein